MQIPPCYVIFSNTKRANALLHNFVQLQKQKLHLHILNIC